LGLANGRFRPSAIAKQAKEILMLSEDAKKIEATLQLSEKTRITIDALSKKELTQEINKKNRSRFQGDKYAYLNTRLAAIQDQEQQEQREEDVAHKTEELTLTREANRISRIAITISVVAVLLALAALAMDII